MSCPFNINGTKEKAFSLVEVLTALTILAMISFSVLVVIDRSTASAANSMQQMRAFEVARENMEKLLSSASVKEGVEYGDSNEYPDIRWETIVEPFYEPITARMWIRGVCSAKYNDPNGQEQIIELEHWLTDLTKEQLLQIMKRDEEPQDGSGELLATLEEAAEYAGVDVETIQQWLENGLLTLEDGSFIKSNLDIYIRSKGNPTDAEKEKQIKSKAELKNKTGQSGKAGDAGQQGQKDEIDPKTGLPYSELEQMDFTQIWDLMKGRQR